MYKPFMYCNKICFRSLCCPLSVQNYHKLKRIHANIVQNPTFLGRFQTFGGQCTCNQILHISYQISAIMMITAAPQTTPMDMYNVTRRPTTETKE